MLRPAEGGGNQREQTARTEIQHQDDQTDDALHLIVAVLLIGGDQDGQGLIVIGTEKGHGGNRDHAVQKEVGKHLRQRGERMGEQDAGNDFPPADAQRFPDDFIVRVDLAQTVFRQQIGRAQKMKNVGHGQDQHGSVKKAAGLPEKEDISDAQHQPGHRDGTQGEKIHRFCGPARHPDAQISEKIGKAGSGRGGQQRKQERIADVGGQPDAVGIGENLREMIQGEGEIVRKGGGEGKADKGQLGKEENQAERQQETQGSPVQPLRGRNQGAVLFPDALLPEKQVKEKGLKKVGIMATDGTVRSDLYKNELNKLGIEAVYPSEDDRFQ